MAISPKFKALFAGPLNSQATGMGLVNFWLRNRKEFDRSRAMSGVLSGKA